MNDHVLRTQTTEFIRKSDRASHTYI